MIEPREIATDVRAFLKSHQEKMLRFLGNLVTMETPSKAIAPQYQILGFLKDELEAIGYMVLHVPGVHTGGYLYARPKNRDKNLPFQLLIGHCDTVWPTDTIKEMPLTFTGGKMRGPGIYDMKAGLTQLYFALLTIKAMQLSTKVTPIVLINSDEEIGSKESSNAIKRLAKIADRAYVLEPPLGLEGSLKTARKGLGRFTITVKGKAAHAGLDPSKGANAIVELSHQIQSLYAMNDLERGITVNVGMIEGGISPNVVAPKSKAVIDVRILNAVDGEYISGKIMGLKPYLEDVELHISGGIGRPPMQRTVRNRKLWEMAKRQGQYLGIELEEATAGGGSDANTTSLFTATLDGLGTPGDGAHATFEYILHNRLIERTALLILLLLAEPLNKKL
ncbi:MAG: M20 family metallopeptidase [Saonia sp.]